MSAVEILTTANETTVLVLYCSCLKPESGDAVVWIGVVGVVPRNGCELLSADEGAYTNFLTLAKSDSEFRAKVTGALSFYQLELVEFEDVRPLSAFARPSKEILVIAAELEEKSEPATVRKWVDE